MIILAVTVVISLNNTGIITKANNTVDKSNLQQVKSLASIAWADAYVEGARTKAELEKAVLDALKENKVDTNKYEINVDENGVEVKPGDGTNVNPDAVTNPVYAKIYSSDAAPDTYLLELSGKEHTTTETGVTLVKDCGNIATTTFKCNVKVQAKINTDNITVVSDERGSVLPPWYTYSETEQSGEGYYIFTGEFKTGYNIVKARIVDEIKPISIITLRSSEVPAAGQSIRNEELIKQYGENELIIEEDYFAYTDALRQSFLEEASFLFGLTYNPINVDLEGSVYLSFNDVINISNLKNEQIKTYCLNNYHTYNGTLYNSISVPALTEVEEKYNYQNEDKTKRTKTAIEIDKANAKITQVVEQVGDHETILVQHTQSLEGLEQKVSKVAAYKSEATGTTQIHLTEAGALNILELEIKGNKTYEANLFPRTNLFPRSNLHPNQRGG